MHSLILRTLAIWLLPALVLASFYLLLRGHQAPGGGFAAGLTAATGYVLLAIAHGPQRACDSLPLAPVALLALGLGVALLSALAALTLGAAPMTGLWWTLHLPRVGEIALGTPLLFDLGVYLLVIGAVTGFILSLTEEDHTWTSS